MQKWLMEETMIMGYDVAHPTGCLAAAVALASAAKDAGDRPSVVGVSEWDLSQLLGPIS